MDAPMADGLTSMIFYDSNLTDGVGLDSSAGMAIPDVGTLSTINVSISSLIGQLTTATGFSFGSGSAGSALLSVNAEQEFSVSISDGLGRTVMVAQAQPVAQSANLQAVTWSFSIYDNTFNIGSPKFVAETRSMDALGNIVRSRSDGSGRTLQTVDALGNISTASYDASSNVVSARDPNLVGYDGVYDALSRMTSRTDTFGITTSATYDLGGNVVTSVDGKGNSTTRQYDAADRLMVVVDRLAGQTLYGMDLASNRTSVVDAEGQVTSYTYNDRGLRASETLPDHVGGSTVGTPGYGIVEFTYDPAGRMLRKTDQTGATVTMNYDLASRMTQRDYRTAANSPSGTIADSDTFQFDAASRITSATSGRYVNTVSMSYDPTGRLATEGLTITGQTYTTTREYDSPNRIKKYIYPDGTQVERT